jgi:ribosomal-protein-alanine N-acetyltransferase
MLGHRPRRRHGEGGHATLTRLEHRRDWMEAPGTIATERLDMVWMSPRFMEAALAGDRAAAEASAEASIPAGWPDDHDERFLRMRLRQMTEDQDEGPWLARLMVLRAPGRPMIGHIGFHGKPDGRGMVEVGYTVFAEHRRRGYAFEAVQAMFEWARAKHGITLFRASVGPSNEPSLALVRKLGMRQVGRHWDQVDGEELEFEVERRSSVFGMP